ncbi:MAG: hypothetical protein ABIJ52_06960 [Pseudomonadota bacterium]
MKHKRYSIPAAAVFLGIFYAFSSGASPSGQSERVIALPELERPTQIVVEGGRIYFADSRDVKVYDLRDGRLLRKIGRLGQGPGEFSIEPRRMSVLGDRLIVQDMRHADCFNLDGVSAGQIKHPGSMAFYPVLPVGRNVVGFPIIRDDEGSMLPSGRIYDSRLKLIRDFYGALPALPSAPPPPGRAMKKSDELLIRDYGVYAVYGNRIYVADSRRGLSISVFDENGLLLSEINPPVDKVKVPKGFVDAVVKEWKASKDWQTYYSYLNPVVPEYFPAFMDFKLDKGRLCFLTAAKKNDLYEIIIMDLEGKILERKFRFPLKPNFEYPFYNGNKYDIDGNKLIWFDYNDDKEIYELHIR